MITDKANSGYCRELEAQIKRHICKCGKEIYIAWVNGEYHIKCNKCGLEPEIVKVKSDYQLWKEGILIDPYRDMIARRQEERRKRNANQGA